MKALLLRIVALFHSIRLAWLFHFRLKPRILKMKKIMDSIVKARSERFPSGKSIFSFPGTGDTIFFVILKEGDEATIQEVYDEIFHPLPENHRLLQQVGFREILG